IVRENDEALDRLSAIADAFLTHNRDIEVVCDDSVIRTFEGREMPLRRSRGYAPMPVNLPHAVESILAVGAELKATFCVTKGHFAYLSQHIGDMGTLETQRAFERALDHMLRLFRVDPHKVVCDLHPGYRSSQWAGNYARERQLPLQKVQHHHAHVAALIAESGLALETPIIGVAFDGTGYGTDGAIWGGEVLITQGRQFDRFLHLRYVPLAGGDATIKYPIRSALSHLYAAGLRHDLGLDPVLHRQIERNINCVPSSSMGRLFDAVAALIGLRRQVSYEGQAAIELESISTSSTRGYPADIRDGVFDPAPLLAAILEDLKSGIPREEIAAAFHTAVAAWIVKASRLAREQTGLNLVGLTGGVFQNVTLLREAAAKLREDNFEVLVHRKVPANDGGLALGQAALYCL
ncbi:MAG TPA: carbamoyltransferase HypF, partial [Bryobacteraceae bacterium]|nr:carbamoyltransferase HypF [Bryobacteraceae bacterium]